MITTIKDWLNKLNTSVWDGERHKWDCPCKRKEFTIIDNYNGRKIHNSNRKYCFYCGTKLR